MSDWEHLVVERSGTLGRIVLNQPERRNALNRRTAEEILSALRQHLADDNVRSIEITGSGDCFCAGGDLSEMQRLGEATAEQAYDWPQPIVEAHELMLRAGKPVIAAVDGSAYAGGFGLAGMCDIVLATRRSDFGMPEVKLGLYPMIIVAHLVRSLPRKRLLEMIMTGDPIDAEEAHRIGFVSKVFENRGSLDQAVLALSRKFEGVRPAAIRDGRRAFAVLADIPAHLSLEAAQFMNLRFLLGGDFKDGTKAFFEKRLERRQKSSGE